jgi:hypothetical protein
MGCGEGTLNPKSNFSTWRVPSYITALEERAGIFIDIIQHCPDDHKSVPHIATEPQNGALCRTG